MNSSRSANIAGGVRCDATRFSSQSSFSFPLSSLALFRFPTLLRLMLNYAFLWQTPTKVPNLICHLFMFILRCPSSSARRVLGKYCSRHLVGGFNIPFALSLNYDFFLVCNRCLSGPTSICDTSGTENVELTAEPVSFRPRNQSFTCRVPGLLAGSFNFNSIRHIWSCSIPHMGISD